MKKIGNVLFLYFFVFVMCMGASFAWYVWKGSEVNVDVNFADLEPYIKYASTKVSGDTITPSEDYTGGISNDITFNKESNADNLNVYGHVYIKITNADSDNLFKASNLKWTLVSVMNNTETVISTGNFVGESVVSDNDTSKMIPAYINFPLTKNNENTTYKVYVWVDSNAPMNKDISSNNISVETYVEANAYTSDADKLNELHIREIEYQEGKITKIVGYSSINNITHYMITNSTVNPSSSDSGWVSISSSSTLVTITPNYIMNDNNNICIKNSNNEVYCKSIGKYSDEVDRPTNTLCKSNLIYNGFEQQLVSSVSGVGYTLSEKDYKQTNAGTYKITATLKDNYSWKTEDSDNSYTNPSTFNCSIAAYDLSNATIASVSNQTYTGNAITPTPAVTVPLPSGSTTTLVSGTDFTYSYSNNKNAGAATITVTGKGNYTGTKSINFNILYETYTVTLDNQDATSAGTTTLYGRYADGIYLDSSYSKKMTTSSNNITVPTRTGYTFLGYYTATNGGGTQLINASGNVTSSFTSTLYNSNTTLYAYWKDKTAPTCNSISGGTSLKSTSQTLTASCSDTVGVTGYYWSKDSTTVPTASSTWSTSKTSIASASGTYRLWARDAAGNISSAASVTIVSYTVNNLLEKVDGTTGTYTSANYASASSSSYIVKSGTSLTLASIYTVPTGSSTSNFKGYSTSFSTTAASLSTTAPSASVTTYYMWFNRNTFTLTLNNGNTTAISSVSGAGTYKYGKSVSISASVKSGYTFGAWTVNSGNTPASTSSASTTVTITQNTTLTASASDKTAPTCSISGGTTLKSTSQTLTASCSDTVGVTGYYWSKDSATAPTTSSTWSTSKTFTASASGTYRLWARDEAGNISSATSVTIVSYTVNNLLEKVDGTAGTYTSANYASASSSSYIVKSGTSLTLASIYAVPTGSSASNFKGYSTSFSTTAASLSTTAPSASGTTYYMWFNRSTFTLTLNNGNTTAISSVSGAGTYKYGKSVSISASVKSGYTFGAWTVNSGNTPASTSSASTTVTITQNTTLTVNAKANSYIIKFNTNGGTGTMSDMQMTYGTASNLTSNAFKKQYTVTYNYDNATSGNSVSSATATYNFVGWTMGGPNLYSKLNLNSNSFSIDANGMYYTNENNNTTSNQYVNFFFNTRNDIVSGNDYTEISVIKSLDYTGSFLYHVGDSHENTLSQITGASIDISNLKVGNNYFPLKGSTNSNPSLLSRGFITIPIGASLSIKFRPVLIASKYNNIDMYYYDKTSVKNLSSVNGSTVNLYADWNEMPVTLPTPTKTGYTFDGWYTSSSGGTKVGNGGSTYIPTSNLTLYARWSINSYSISYELNGGSASGNPTTYNVNSSTITLNNPTKSGSIFLGWYGSNDASSGLGSYTSSNTYTANGRDHILGNDFSVSEGEKFRIFVTAKRTSGSLDMQGGIWYTEYSSGTPYDNYSGIFSLYESLGNGYSKYYKDVTIPSGKSKGKFYIQVNQDASGGDTTWLLYDMHAIKLGSNPTIPKGSTGNKSYTANWLTSNTLTINKGTGVSTIYYKVNGASSYTSSTSNVSVSVSYGTTYYYYGTASTGYTVSSCTSSSPCSGTMGTSAITKSISANINYYNLTIKGYDSVGTGYYKINGASSYTSFEAFGNTITLSVKYGSTYYYYATPVDNTFYMAKCSQSSPCSGTMGASDVTVDLSGKSKSTNTLTVSARSLTYTGSAQSLVTASSAQGTVYYAVGTQLTSSNYSSSGSTTIPTGINAGTYTVYYYTPGNTTYLSKSSSVKVTINGIYPTTNLTISANDSSSSYTINSSSASYRCTSSGCTTCSGEGCYSFSDSDWVTSTNFSWTTSNASSVKFAWNSAGNYTSFNSTISSYETKGTSGSRAINSGGLRLIQITTYGTAASGGNSNTINVYFAWGNSGWYNDSNGYYYYGRSGVALKGSTASGGISAYKLATNSSGDNWYSFDTSGKLIYGWQNRKINTFWAGPNSSSYKTDESFEASTKWMIYYSRASVKAQYGSSYDRIGLVVSTSSATSPTVYYLTGTNTGESNYITCRYWTTSGSVNTTCP